MTTTRTEKNLQNYKFKLYGIDNYCHIPKQPHQREDFTKTHAKNMILLLSYFCLRRSLQGQIIPKKTEQTCKKSQIPNTAKDAQRKFTYVAK